MAAKFELLQRGSGVLYGECGAIWVMVLHAKPTAPEMYLARPALKTMQQRHPDGFPALTWVLPSAGFSMDSDARHAAAEVTKEFDAVLIAQATIIEGTGFQAAAVRAIVHGLDLMARSRAPKKTFAELAPTVAWCAGHRTARDRDACTADDVVESLVAVRTAIERGGPMPG